MKVSIDINKHQVVVAVMHRIGVGVIFNSRRDFNSEMKTYFRLYGISCIEDHESENDKYRDAAQFIVDKYFK